MRKRTGLVVQKNDQGAILVWLYNTCIVRMEDGLMTLHSGGWRTNHTKNCMNDYLRQYGYYLHQSKGVWYVGSSEYRDGMQLNLIGQGAE